jgi:hypothetical protein
VRWFDSGRGHNVWQSRFAPKRLQIVVFCVRALRDADGRLRTSMRRSDGGPGDLRRSDRGQTRTRSLRRGSRPLQLDSSYVKYACLAFGAVALAVLLAGCTINDPTENEFAPQIINDTLAVATIAYCDRSSSCKSYAWTETLRSGKRVSDSINAGRGNLSVFVVSEEGTHRCIRLARYTKTIRLSQATRTACHPPYG